MNRGYTFRQVLSQAAGGVSLLHHLTAQHPHSDATTWRARICAGEVTLDGGPADPEHLLRAGQVLEWNRPPWVEPPAPGLVATIYEDEHLLAVHKPAGLPTLPGAGFLDRTLLSIVRLRHPDAAPMHRLGRGTSGVVLFAMTHAAASAVQAEWRRPGAVGKVYRALVDGSPSASNFAALHSIGRLPDAYMRGGLYSASASGKPARSEVTVLERRNRTTLVEVRIVTGRPHQIRIHLAAAGHPLSGDPLYGIGGTRQEGSTARPGDLGYHLHALSLSLTHPATGERITFEAQPPALLQNEEAPGGQLPDQARPD